METAQAVAAGATSTISQTSESIASPKLWSPASPILYKVYTEVYDGSLLVDNCVSPLGFRWFSWSATAGFSLNGQRLWLKGANCHQDHAGWGDAITDAGNERDVKMIKDCGMNFIRGSHYPHAPAFARACDSIGICLWAEAPFWSSITGGDATDWRVSGYPTSASDQAGFDANTPPVLHSKGYAKVFVQSSSASVSSSITISSRSIRGRRGPIPKHAHP